MRDVSLGTAPDGSLKVSAGAVLSFLTIAATVNVTTSGGISTVRAIKIIGSTGLTLTSI